MRWYLDQAHFRDRLVAKIAVDPLYQPRRIVLEFKRGRPRYPQVQHAPAPLPPRKGQFFRLAHAGDLGPDDGRPVDNQIGMRETAPTQGLRRQFGDELSHRARFTTAPGTILLVLCPGVVAQVFSLRLFRLYSTGMTLGDATRATEILDWYDRHRRAMPWRAPSGVRPDPYAVWLSEIMLQQTTVATVGPYFTEFMSRWPTIEGLAAAKLDDVLHAWQGLGYYARARNLHRCAIAVTESFAGRFPEDEKTLLSLPGVGPYTAAAIRAIAFDKRAVVVDGNVERVMARLYRETDPLPDVKSVLRERAEELTPDARPGDYAQAVMDLGATVCIPRRPKCMLCPWTAHCRGKDIAESLPARRPKPEKPTRYGTIFWIERPDGSILVRRRSEKGLLGGMMEFPSTDWRDGSRESDVSTLSRQAPLTATEWYPVSGIVRHVFTHFRLELTVLKGHVAQNTEAPTDTRWSTVDGLADLALPTVMKKVAEKAIGGG